MGMKKKVGYIKSWMSKQKEIPYVFFPTKIGQKPREFPLLFFAKYTRFVRNFLKILFLVFFSNFYTTDTLKRFLGGQK